MKRPDMNLGDVVVFLGFCDRAAVARAATEQINLATEGIARPLGEILVDHDSITRAQLVEALREQHEVRRSPSAAAKAVLRRALEKTAHMGVTAGGTR